MTKFDQDTAVRAADRGRYEGVVSPDWRIVRGANGGHLAAMLLRAMTEEVGDAQRYPVSFTAHFARVPKETTVDLEASVERSGRTMSTVSGRMVQDGKVVITGLAAFTTPRTGPEFSELSMPEVPFPEDLEVVPDREDFNFGRQFDFRRCVGPDFYVTAERAEIGVWLRLREPQPLDHFVVTQLCDAFAPAVFAKLGQGAGGAGVPTIELTIHYREPLPLPDPSGDEWYLAIFRTLTARAGFIEEDGWLWRRDGTLIAQSRQCALLS
jgi:acyl-CoA thioesterase